MDVKKTFRRIRPIGYIMLVGMFAARAAMLKDEGAAIVLMVLGLPTSLVLGIFGTSVNAVVLFYIGKWIDGKAC